MIRPGRPADLPALRSLQAGAVHSPVPALLALGAHGPGATLLVSTDGGTPVGYALAVADEATEAEPVTDAATASLVEIAVEPSARRQGRATALVEALAGELAVDELRLTARADDERALSFYRAAGFSRVRRLPDHYDAGGRRIDGVLLTREA